MNTTSSLRTSRIRLAVTALVLAACLAAVSPVQADLDAIQLKVVNATGFVVVNKSENRLGYGTCWVVDAKKSLVVTNAHVIGNAETCKVAFPRFSRGLLVTESSLYQVQDFTNGKVLACDSKRDLALIQLEQLPRGAQALELAPASMSPGSKVWAVGNSGMGGKSLHDGSLWRQREGTVKKGFFWKTGLKGSPQVIETRMIQTDSGSRPGDSGGPVVDEHGRIVGVNSSSNFAGDYAIDVSELREFLARCVPSPNLPPPQMGLAGTWTVTWRHNDRDGFAGLMLKADGTCTWEGVKESEGTYKYLDGRMTMNMPGAIVGSGDVVWTTHSTFQFTVQFSDGTIEFTARRR